jgi:hypothetical protein
MVKRSYKDRLPSRGTLWTGSLAYLAAYAVMQWSGLFGLPPSGIMQLVHRGPVIAGIIVLMTGSTAMLLEVLRSPAQGDRRPLSRVFLHSGLLIACAGVLASGLMRFEGSIILSEGQDARVTRADLDPAAVSAGRFASWPEEQIRVLEVSPFFPEKGAPVRGKRAHLFCRDREHPGGREAAISSLLPTLIEGFSHQIGAVGYSPHFVLFSQNGAVIEDGYAVLDLYPPGAEDFFRVPQIPHTFYLRYYPDASLIRDAGTAVGGTKGPLFKVRIARNLDLIDNQYVSPYALMPVDSLVLSLQDVKRWVEIRIVRDPGYVLLFPGLFLTTAGCLALAIERVRSRREGRDASGTA